MGVIEAQHNLAIEYLSGSLIKKNEMKAFAWFIHAGQLGFPHSKVLPY
jgi:TPR repeat protein